MNTANLQMEGVLLALAALCESLRSKGILSDADLAQALARAEHGTCGREPRLSEANIEAVRFPIRFLRCALKQEPGALDYETIAATVGRARDAVPVQSK